MNRIYGVTNYHIKPSFCIECKIDFFFLNTGENQSDLLSHEKKTLVAKRRHYKKNLLGKE